MQDIYPFLGDSIATWKLDAEESAKLKREDWQLLKKEKDLRLARGSGLAGGGSVIILPCPTYLDQTKPEQFLRLTKALATMMMIREGFPPTMAST